MGKEELSLRHLPFIMASLGAKRRKVRLFNSNLRNSKLGTSAAPAAGCAAPVQSPRVQPGGGSAAPPPPPVKYPPRAGTEAKQLSPRG